MTDAHHTARAEAEAGIERSDKALSEARRAWAHRTITRLRAQPTGDMALTPRQRERLVRAVMMEYGND